MEDIISRTVAMGMGAVNVTREKAEKFVEELVKRGQVPKQEATNVVEALIKRGEQEGKEIKGAIGRWVQQALSEAGVPTRQEMERMDKRLAALEEHLGITPEPEADGGTVPEERMPEPAATECEPCCAPAETGGPETEEPGPETPQKQM